MYILAIETTGPVGSVAIAEESGAETRNRGADNAVSPGKRIPMKVTTRQMSHLKNLIPMASELLSEEGIEKKEIAAVAASTGPGSFTGIRIGVSTARALAQAWDVPCINVPSLDEFRDLAVEKPVCVIFNARRGQVYGACYGASGEELIAPGPYMLKDMLTRIETLRLKPVFYGDGVDAYFDTDEFRERVSMYEKAPVEDRYQTAALTAKYALKVWKERESSGKMGTKADTGGKVVEYGQLTPDYMRESEAEQRLKDGSLEKMRKAKLEKLMKMAGK